MSKPQVIVTVILASAPCFHDVSLKEKFVAERIANVYTFGSPSVAKVYPKTGKRPSVLSFLNLRESLVNGYVQPWDPTPRFFSEVDVLYPIFKDLGKDGATFNPAIPPRILRPVIRALLHRWKEWPQIREERHHMLKQSLTSVGQQHVILPRTNRYLVDMTFEPLGLGLPVGEAIIRLSSIDLFPTLNKAFPLHAENISKLAVTSRGVLHHLPQGV